jgi:hypothetical protein
MKAFKELLARRGVLARDGSALQRIRTRQTLAKNVFSDRALFADFLASQLPDAAERDAWLQHAAALNRPALERHAARSGQPELLHAAAADQYRELLVAGFVDPAIDFPDAVPPLEMMCQLTELMGKDDDDAVANREAIVSEWRRSVDYFKNRWELLTGTVPFEGQPRALPLIRDLTARKAPVAARTAWTRELAIAEARALHHRLPGDPVPALPAAGAAAVGGCSRDEIFALAGANPPRGLADDDPRYSFPGRPLNNTEEIYYD